MKCIEGRDDEFPEILYRPMSFSDFFFFNYVLLANVKSHIHSHLLA